MRGYSSAKDSKTSSGFRPDRSGSTSTATSPASKIGPLFRDLRRCFRFSVPEVAFRLGTRIDVIEALEAGDVSKLPPWPETVRLVTAYTGFAQIDPRPVLEVISDELAALRKRSAKGPVRRSKTLRVGVERVAAHLASTLNVRRLAETLAQIKASSALRWPLALAQGRRSPARLALACAVLAALLTSLIQSPVLQASGGSGALGRVILTVQDYVLQRSSTKKNGMTWIDVEDPRSRRTDKLQVPQQ
jgi:hypothetical protein